MTDLHERFRAADRIPAPDLWPEIQVRGPGSEPRPPRWPRNLTGVAAVVATALLVVLLARLLPLTNRSPSTRKPAATTGFGTKPSPTPTSISSEVPVPGVAPAVVPFGTFGVNSNVMSARDGRLYAVTNQTQERLTVVRIDTSEHEDVKVVAGPTASRRITSPVAFYFGAIYAGPEGIYVGSQVIPRLSQASDMLLRLDPNSLAVTASRTVPGSVAGMVAVEGELWVAAGNDVLRLDPISLATRTSQAVAGLQPPPQGAESVSAPAVTDEGVWVLVGSNRANLRLLRLDRRSLKVLSTASLAGLQDEEFFKVVGAPGGGRIQWVWLVGTGAVQRVNPLTGQLWEQPIAVGKIDGQAQPYGGGLVALVTGGAGGGAIVVLNGQGSIVAGTQGLGDVADLTVAAPDIWVAQGLQLLHVRLLAEPPGCLCG